MSANDDFTIISSHDAYSGSYAVFRRFRLAVVAAYRRKYNMGYFYPGGHPGLTVFLSQNSSDKWIEPEVCAKIAAELGALLPELEEEAHDLDARRHVELTRQFISGCRKAAEANEPLTFEDSADNAFGLWYRSL